MKKKLDTTEIAELAHNVISTGREIVENTAEEAKTPEEWLIVERIRTVVDAQSVLIQRLLDHQIMMTEEIEKFVAKYEAKK